MSHASDASGTLSLAHVNDVLTISSTKQRIKVWSQVLKHFQAEEWSDDKIKGAIQLIFTALPRYADRASQSAVENVVTALGRKAATKPEILNWFAARMSKIAHPSAHAGTLAVLFRWSVSLLEGCHVSAADGFMNLNTLNNFLSSQCTALECLDVSSADVKGAIRRVAGLISRVPVLFDVYLSKATENNYVGITYVLLTYATKPKNAAVFDANKAKFLEVYVKTVLQSKTKPSPSLHQCFRELFPRLTHEDCSTVLIPTIQRVMKRNPESVLESLFHLFSDLKIDLSAYAMEVIFPNITQLLRSDSKVTRDEAVRIVAAFGKNSSDSTVIVDILNGFIRILNGSEGALSQWHQRLGMVSAVEALGCVSWPRSSQPALEEVVDNLAKLSSNEANEDVRLMAVKAWARWTVHRGLISAVSEANLKKGLTEKNVDSVKACYAEALSSVLTHMEDVTVALKLVSVLKDLLVSSAPKPSVSTRSIALHSLKALVVLAHHDPEAERVCTSSGVWNMIQAVDSFLNSPAALSKASISDMSAQVDLISFVALRHTSKISAALDDKHSAFWRTFVTLLTASDHAVTASAIKALNRLKGAIPEAPGSVLISLCDLVNRLPALQAAEKIQSAKEKEASSNPALNQFGTESTLRSAVRACCDAVIQDMNLLPNLLWIAHHPVLGSFHAPSSLWLGCLHRLGSDFSSHLGEYLKAQRTAIVSLLFGTDGLTSKVSEHQQAARQALASLAVTEPVAFVDSGLFDTIIDTLKDIQDLASLSAYQSGVFYGSDDVLFVLKGDEDDDWNPIITSGPVKDANKKRNKLESKLYGQADDQWEAELRKELDAKKKKAVSSSAATVPVKGSAKGGKSMDAAKQEKDAKDRIKMEQQKQQREQLKLKAIQTEQALQLLRDIAHLNHKLVHSRLESLLPLVLPLLRSPLAVVVSSAWSTLQTLPKTLPKPLDALAATVAMAMKNIYQHYDLDSNENISLFTRIITSLSMESSSLDGSSLAVFFPILKAVFNSPHAHSLLDSGLGLFRQLLLQDSPLPIGPSLDAMMHVLQVASGVAQRFVAEECLNMVARRINDEQHMNQLLNGALSSESHVRLACLMALNESPIPLPFDEYNGTMLFMLQFDDESAVQTNALHLWRKFNFELVEDFATHLLPLLIRWEPFIRTMSAKALAAAVEKLPTALQDVTGRLFKLYVDESNHEDGGMREGVCVAFKYLAPHLTAKDLPTVFQFFITRGLADEDERIRQLIVESGLEVVNRHGHQQHALILPLLEAFLDKSSSSMSDEEAEIYDREKEGVVVYLGGLAKHLEPGNPKISAIVNRLIDALHTPSEIVQRAVGQCLPPLVPAVSDHKDRLISEMISQLTTGARFGDRRGAAFGLAGIVKGLGIQALKQHNIIQQLQTAVENKADPNARQGALFGFECLSEFLGRLFEPYVIHILPLLLASFSDSVGSVRDAAQGAARAIMAQLSGHAVKLLLPSLLKGLGDRAWRTKLGSIEVLGAMAFCAPRQLSSCLPQIVPKLSEVVTDTHPKVQEAAKASLKDIGSVIRNPEILNLVPTLLRALESPAEGIKPALQALMDTSFIHSIDSPSLALIMPMIHRGLRERGTEVKNKACKIVGNMCSLVADPKDLIPYLHMLLPDIKANLVDPIPEVRAVSAKALGTLTKGVGEEHVSDLLPWLLETLKADTSSVERSGAAQGLSELLVALGSSRIDGLLSGLLANASHPKASVREGHIGLFVFLPTALGSEFQIYLHQVLPVILQGLADEAEAVRDVSMRAAQSLVNQYAKSHTNLILPALEEGLFHENWRIRQSSVQLLGDLLDRLLSRDKKQVVAGNTEEKEGADDGSDEDADSTATPAAAAGMGAALGQARRDSILASLYIIRSDTSAIVRQSAVQVWKSVVTNTPKTLKEILPVLMTTLIVGLASPSAEKRQVSGRSLGDIVNKLGERVLPDIIPILQQGISSTDGNKRQGVCLGLTEVIESAGKVLIAEYTERLMPTVQKALCDRLPEVREAAAMAFNTLHKNVGVKALDDILPGLLRALDQATGQAGENPAEDAMQGLREILILKSSVVLPYLLPKLLTPPLSVAQARALAAIADAPGVSLHAHLGRLLPALLQGIAETDATDTARKSALTEAAKTVALSVQKEGLQALFGELLKFVASDVTAMRIASLSLLEAFCSNTKVEFDSYIPMLLQTLLKLFNESDRELMESAWSTFAAVAKAIKKDDQSNHLVLVRNALKSIAYDAKGKQTVATVAALCLPKGLDPLLGMFQHGLMYGSPEVREQAAAGLGDLIHLTTVEALKPFVVKITGPLIRIVGDRFPWQVKGAILDTLSLLIGKGGVALKPFLPQLQTTFVKALHDPTKAVRARGATALGKLMSLQTRVDPLIQELITGAQSDQSESGVRESMLDAVTDVLSQAGANVSATVLENAVAMLTSVLLQERDDTEFHKSAASAFGIACEYLSADELRRVLLTVIFPDQHPHWSVRAALSLALSAVLKRVAWNKLTPYQADLVQTINRFLADDKVPVKDNAIECVFQMLYQVATAGGDTGIMSELIPSLANMLKDTNSDLRRSAVNAVKRFAKLSPEMTQSHLNLLIPPLMQCVRDPNISVKLAAERAMVHTLQLQAGETVLQTYLKSADQATARTLGDYAKRVLSKIATANETSEDEKDE